MTIYISDLHIHSRYSGGCSKNLTLDLVTHYAKFKGLSIMGTGDFTYKKWLDELKDKLKQDDEKGLYFHKKEDFKIYYVPQSEINILSDEGRKGIKRIHNIILAPNFETVEQINDLLSNYGSLENDARPNIKIDPSELVEILKNIDDMIEIIPSHIFTPWFGLFGSFGGYDSINECYKDKVNKIYALETGLSADPTYIHSISELDGFSIVSFSDLHSYYPHRIGREATVFNFSKLSYKNIINSLRLNNEDLIMTLEFKPEEGKYNYDGCRREKHKNGEDVFFHPSKTPNDGRCPICKRKITKGVLNRVIELSDRPLSQRPNNTKPFKYIIPLTEIIALSYGIGTPWSKKVIEIYMKLVKLFGSEYNILLDDKLSKEYPYDLFEKKLLENIEAIKEGKFYFDPPGHDGEYGILNIGQSDKFKVKPEFYEKKKTFQKSITEF